MKRLASFLLIVAILFLSLLPPTALAANDGGTFKHISVDLEHQMLYAWEGNQIVSQTPISSGLPQSPTVRGTFRIYLKYKYQEMRGISPVHGYYDLPNVPNVMYFYEGYAIHGAYWHNNFGHPMSNGCVNVPLRDAAWLYNFSPIGTSVTIY